MADRPISPPASAVRAILAGRKVQHRLPIKLYPSASGTRFMVYPPEELIELEPGEFRRGVCHYASTGALSGPWQLPHKVGHQLWVRETCRAEELSRPQKSRPATRRERQAFGRTTMIECDMLDGADGVRYLADDEWIKIKNSATAGDAWSDLFHAGGHPPGGVGRWRQAPRWASRLTLLVTDVRVERLQDISEADAIAEGCPGCLGPNPDFPDDWDPSPLEDFEALWSTLHGPGLWDRNPWVAAITFEAHPANIDALPAAAPEMEAADV